MVRLFYCLVLFSLLVVQSVMAHKEWVHQYLVRQGYWLLELQHGAAITELKNHMGFNSTGRGNDDDPWGTGDISLAVWREDYDDPLWGYGGWFGGGWTPSITHFWNADLGDSHRMPIPWGPGYAPNALEKARVYLFGGQRIFFRKKQIAADLGGQIIAGRFYSYNSLIEFFQTGRAFEEGYVDLAGYAHYYGPYEVYLPLVTARKWAFQILGRVAHLLQDMSVPAHVKDDTHPCELDQGDDYELYMGGNSLNVTTCNDPQTSFPAQIYSSSSAVRAGGVIIPPSGIDPIRYLFYLTTQVADHFPSRDFPGNNGLPNGSDPFLQKLYAQLGPPPASVVETEIGSVAVDFAIRSTAGLFHWFAVEVGLIPRPIYVPNDYSAIAQALSSASSGQTVIVFGGTHNVSGTLSIPSGVSLFVLGEANFYFASGAQLSVNGRIFVLGNFAERIEMNRQTTGMWQGITFNTAGGSWIEKCDITYATMPIKATNTNNLTISNVTIGNSNFYNGSDDAALAFYNSSPTITSVTINGQTGSWNGVRFAQGSTGSITHSTIQNCGAGNGIVVQGNSSPTISSNTIRNNYYHGIIVVNNGTGNPVITGNTVESNGIVNGNKTYNGLNFYYSSGKVVENTVRYSNFGIYCDSYSSPSSSHGGQGKNLLTANRFGILVHYNSNPSFGVFNSATSQYFGACNKILTNDVVNAKAQYSSTLWVQGAWWGADPPDASKIVAVENSLIEYSYWRPFDDNDCIYGPQPRIAGTTTTGTDDVPTMLRQAVIARLQGNFAQALTLYRTALASSLKPAEQQRALVGLFEVYRDSNDLSVLPDITRYQSAASTVGLVATELLMPMYASMGRFEEARGIAVGLTQRYRNSETEQRALIMLASLGGFSESQRAVSQRYLTELVQRHSSTVDKGLLTALGAIVSEGSAKIASDETQLSISNYPNPFNPTTVIRFTVPEAGTVSLKVFDLLGREVATLVNEHRAAGAHQVLFDASSLPSGVYFYRLESAGRVAIQKMVLAR